MAIEKSISGIGQFLQNNDDLVKEISEAVGATVVTIEGLANRVEANRREAEALVRQLGQTEFAIARDVSVRASQKRFLDEIAEVGKKIREFRDHPDILVHLYAERGALYVGLANSYNDLVGQMITFTPAEVEDIRIFLRRATLDAQARQRWADVLDAAVQITKLSLRVAAKLVI